MQSREINFDYREDAPLQRGGPSQADDPGTIELTPELCAELLDPKGWGKILELYAGTMKLAVALIDSAGKLVGKCHNPQPIWSLAREVRPDRAGSCLFCLETSPHCSAAADALRTASPTLVHDLAGFAHVALPFSLGGQHVGTLLAGQVLDRYPEPLPLQRAAREFGLSQQELWHLARQQAPMSRAVLTVYGELLWALGQTFLRDRYGAIMGRRWTEITRALNQELASVNSTLNRKVAELDRSNSDLQNLLDSTEIATIFLDRDLRVKKFTPAGGTLIQLDAGDIGRHITDLGEQFAEAGLVKDITELAGIAATGSDPEDPIVRERDMKTPNGGYYLMRILPYRTVQGVVDGVVITFGDVTELKAAERKADLAKVYAENIVATVREPLLVLNEKFRVVSANEAFYRKFQVKAGETEGRVLFELGNGQWNIPELRRLLGELLPREQWVQDFEMEHDFVHIGPRTMVLNARRIDHVDLILLAIEDITARKVSENLLTKLNLDLKHFSYAASHDLQEPLRMVTSYTQLLARDYKGKLDPRADLFIAYTIEGANRIETLLHDLREYWLVNERLAQSVPIDCLRVLQKTIKTLRVPIEESGASVTYDSLPTVVAEEVSLAMLFQNLLGNAIKYSRPGETPRIHVSAQKNANSWCFSVTDNGIGIGPEHLEDIFAPFKRLHGRDYPGTGIGLALCHKIVERYGGRLWVESVYGEGSTFFFTIPVSA